MAIGGKKSISHPNVLCFLNKKSTFVDKSVVAAAEEYDETNKKLYNLQEA